MTRPKANQRGEIQPRPKPDASLADLVHGMRDQLAIAIPRHLHPDRMGRLALTALKNTPRLHRCTPRSFVGSLLQAVQLGLEPNTPLGECYLIPRKNGRASAAAGHEVLEATFLLGYRGILSLARRSGECDAIYAQSVFEGDDFEVQLGMHPDIQHRPRGARSPKTLTHVYAVGHLKGARLPVFEVLDRDEVEMRRNRSPASKSGPWVTDYQRMAEKTAIRALARWLPQSPELARAAVLDEAPEVGQPQSLSWSPETHEALERANLDAMVDVDDDERAEGDAVLPPWDEPPNVQQGEEQEPPARG